MAHDWIQNYFLDIADRESVGEILRTYSPWGVIHAAGYVKVDQAETEPERCYRETVTGSEVLAQVCANREIPVLAFSSDLVFNGEIDTPYLESHPPAPLSVYGRCKAEAERRMLNRHDGAIMIRTSAFFGARDEYNFIIDTLRRLSAGHEVIAIENITFSPTYVPDLVNTSLDLLIDGEKGIWHLVNQGAVTWAELARMVAARARVNVNKVVGMPSREYPMAAPRPAYCALGSERASLLPSFDSALSRFFSELPVPLLG